MITFGWSQKKELKQAQKLYRSAKISEAKASLDANQALLESAELKYAAPYNLLRSQITLAEEAYQASYDYLQLAQKDSGLSSKTDEQKRLLIFAIINTAIEQSDNKEFITSAENLYLSYVIDPEANADYLYFAASNAVNASDYELSLKYYQILKDTNYTGIMVKYYVTEVANNIEIEVSESEYSIYQKSKDYINFRTADTESKFPEIVKNIALIYNQLGEKEKAIAAVKDARAESPNDLGLILTEANIYIELGEKEKFQVLMGEAIAQDPENANLYYNLALLLQI